MNVTLRTDGKVLALPLEALFAAFMAAYLREKEHARIVRAEAVASVVEGYEHKATAYFLLAQSVLAFTGPPLDYQPTFQAQYRAPEGWRTCTPRLKVVWDNAMNPDGWQYGEGTNGTPFRRRLSLQDAPGAVFRAQDDY